ncbi:MAG TPA: hypothetical protein DD732_10230 [Rhizobiales bacterium]|nr:hypothetical protein [Hyphomicrobiales bacterium]
MAEPQKRPARALAEALCGVQMPSDIAGKLAAAIQPLGDYRSPLIKALAGVEPTIKYKPPALKFQQDLARKMARMTLPSEELQKTMDGAMTGNSLAANSAVRQLTTAGLLPRAVHEQMSQAVLPVQQALKARMSPAFGGTFRPSGEQMAGLHKALTGASATNGLVPPTKMPGPTLTPPRSPTIHNRLIDPYLPVRRPRPVPREPTMPAPSPAPASPYPWVSPEEIGELFAQHLMRAYRHEAEELLIRTGLELEIEHLRSIEQRLHSGTRPDRLQAALSANLLLKGLADHLFPPRDEEWESRFGQKHKLGARNISNRLSAFVDPVFRSRLTKQEHRLFQATVDFVFHWSGKGHHVVFNPKEAAEAFCQLLKVLAAVARVHRESG